MRRTASLMGGLIILALLAASCGASIDTAQLTEALEDRGPAASPTAGGATRAIDTPAPEAATATVGTGPTSVKVSEPTASVTVMEAPASVESPEPAAATATVGTVLTNVETSEPTAAAVDQAALEEQATALPELLYFYATW